MHQERRRIGVNARWLEGRPVAEAIWAEVERDARAFADANGRAATLALVLGDDPSASAYARQIERAFGRRGLRVTLHSAGERPPELEAVVVGLSGSQEVDGLILLTPLPAGLEPGAAMHALDPRKDVDGQHPVNAGLLARRTPRFVPNTALGGVRLLEHYGIPTRGRSAVVIGRSPVVGIPLALLLLHADATVTVCHSRTADLAAETLAADLLCVAAGQTGLVGAEHVREGAVVLDFGTNVQPDGSLAGDVRTAEVAARAAAVTPVPGGTGAVTVAVLAQQTLAAARLGMAGAS